MQFGDYRLELIPDTEFRLDGGAMFSVVPRVLWERKCPPDELNRIRMNMNCLFIETPNEKILVETGIGEKWSNKEIAIYGIFREKPFAQTLLEITGCKPEEISIVVNTHLHFDHAGGNTILSEATGFDHADGNTILSEPRAVATGFDRAGGNTILSEPGAVATGLKQRDQLAKIANGRELEVCKTPRDSNPFPQFPNARYFVSESEFNAAENPHERDRASYLPENWQPILESGQLELKPDNYEVVEGLSMQTIRGHSETMQTVRLDRGGKTIYGFADLIPTTAHLPLPWIMGYDLFPTETLEAKRKLLKEAVEEDWICLFYHDFETPLCRLEEIDGKLKAIEYVKS